MIGDALTKGEETQPLLDLTIGELLMRAVEERGNNIALIVAHQNIRWSYSEVANAVDELAGSLLSLGLKKGDRVALCSPNRYEWIVTQLATARVGLILVCINPAYRLHPPSPRRGRPSPASPPRRGSGAIQADHAHCRGCDDRRRLHHHRSNLPGPCHLARFRPRLVDGTHRTRHPRCLCLAARRRQGFGTGRAGG